MCVVCDATGQNWHLSTDEELSIGPQNKDISPSQKNVYFYVIKCEITDIGCLWRCRCRPPMSYSQSDISSFFKQRLSKTDNSEMPLH